MTPLLSNADVNPEASINASVLFFYVNMNFYLESFGYPGLVPIKIIMMLLFVGVLFINSY